jgi:hypothetical protein
VDKYHVVVTRGHVASWEWEIYRNGEPPPARVRDGPYKSVRTAEAVGSVALREFWQAFHCEQKASHDGPSLAAPAWPSKQVCVGWPTIVRCDSVLSSDSGDGAWLANLR